MLPFIPFSQTTRILMHIYKVVPKPGGVKYLVCSHIMQTVAIWMKGTTVSSGISLITIGPLVTLVGPGEVV